MSIHVPQTPSSVIRYSPSQITLFRACKRKWYFQYPLGFKPPSTPSQALGTAIHAELEAYTVAGAEPEDARAREALRHVPRRIGGRTIETEVAIDAPLPIPDRRFVGFIDLLDLATNGAEPHIVDYKTMSDLKWAKADFELEQDVQMLSYAYWVGELWALHAGRFRLSHVQIQTRGGVKSRLTSTVVTRPHVERAWSSYLTIIDEMEETRGAASARDVEPNHRECDSYGGCPHRERCGATLFGDHVILPPDTTRRADSAPPATIDSIRKDQKMKLDQLAAAGNGPAALQTPPPSKAAALLARVSPQLRAALAEPVAAPPAAPAIAVPAGYALALDAEGRPFFQRIEAPVSAPPPALAGSDLVDEGEDAELAAAAEPETPAPSPAVGGIHAAISQPAAPPVEAPAKRGPGRPPGAKNRKLDALTAPAPIVVPIAAAAAPATSVDQLDPQQSTPSTMLEVLYINCMPLVGPLGEAPVPLDVFLAPILEALAKATGIPDWRLHEYGKGAGHLADAVKRAALPRAIIADQRSKTAEVVLGALIPRARLVIQGTS